MILNIIASIVLAYFVARDSIATLNMLDEPYENKGLWFILGVVQILTLFLVAWAVWS